MHYHLKLKEIENCHINLYDDDVILLLVQLLVIYINIFAIDLLCAVSIFNQNTRQYDCVTCIHLSDEFLASLILNICLFC